MPHLGDVPVAEPRRQKDQRTNYSADLSELWLAEPRCARRRRGGRMINRSPRTPELQREMESARAANRRRQRVAPLTHRASMDKDERERVSVPPSSVLF